MATTLYATYSARCDINVLNQGGLNAWSSSESPTASASYRGLYRFPRLEQYSRARSIKLTLYRNGGATASCTTNVYANCIDSSIDTDKAIQLGSITTASTTASATLDLTEHISKLTNMSGSLTHLNILIGYGGGGNAIFSKYDTSGKKPRLVIEAANGVMYIATGGIWQPCTIQYGVGGIWQQCSANYGTGGSWKELGE